MIELENTEVVGWEAAIRGMRNPMNSWERSDSQLCKSMDGFEDCRLGVHGGCPRGDEDYFKENIFCVGKNDFELMQRLARAGTDHRKFMRMIVVYVDVTAPLYWWKEMETYKVGTVSNSCSTMHSIHKEPFCLSDFSWEDLMDYWEYPFSFNADYPTKVLLDTIDVLNKCREMYLETGKKIWWRQMIQLLPNSYNQRRTLMLNYEVLSNIYHARKWHKLIEWSEFCLWIEDLPYSELITGKEKSND